MPFLEFWAAQDGRSRNKRLSRGAASRNGSAALRRSRCHFHGPRGLLLKSHKLAEPSIVTASSR